MNDVLRVSARCRSPTSRSTAAGPSRTSTTPVFPTSTGSGARRWRRTPARTGSTRPRSRACCTMENDLVGFTADLLDAPDRAVGHGHLGRHRVGACWPSRARATPAPTSTAHGWWCRRPCTRRSTRPPTTSASRPSSCRSAPTSGPTRPRWSRRSTRHRRTVLVVGSAPSYAHGVIDPVAAVAAAAAERGIRCHVDACIGGWVLPYAARLGRGRAAVDVRGRRGHLDLGRHPQVRLRPQGHLGPAAPHARRTAAAVLRLRRLAGLHDAQLDHPVDEVRWSARRRLGGRAVAGRPGLRAADPRRVRGGRPDRRRAGRHRRS